MPTHDGGRRAMPIDYMRRRSLRAFLRAACPTASLRRRHGAVSWRRHHIGGIARLGNNVSVIIARRRRRIDIGINMAGEGVCGAVACFVDMASALFS